MVFGGALPVYLMNIIHFVNLCNIVMKCCQGGMCFRGLFGEPCSLLGYCLSLYIQ